MRAKTDTTNIQTIKIISIQLNVAIGNTLHTPHCTLHTKDFHISKTNWQKASTNSQQNELNVKKKINKLLSTFCHRKQKETNDLASERGHHFNNLSFFSVTMNAKSINDFLLFISFHIPIEYFLALFIRFLNLFPSFGSTVRATVEIQNGFFVSLIESSFNNCLGNKTEFFISIISLNSILGTHRHKNLLLPRHVSNYIEIWKKIFSFIFHC